MKSKEQKLVDICFQVAIMVHEHPSFKGKSSEYVVEYVAEQLRECGFDTVPLGSSWGILRNE